MRSAAVVVFDELAKHPTEMLFVEHDQIVETFPPERSHHSLGDGVRLG